MPTRFEKRSSLVIDDDANIALIIAKAISMPTLSFANKEELVSQAPHLSPVSVFVDINLSGGACGLDLIPSLRSWWPHTPLIVITSDPSEGAIRAALTSGANDFIRKPLHLVEVSLRLQTRLAEAEARMQSSLLSFGDLKIDKLHNVIQCGKANVTVSPKEIALLLMLVQSAGMPVSKDAFKRKLWGKTHVSLNSIDRKIFELRAALADVGSRVSIRAKYGVGVSLVDETVPKVEQLRVTGPAAAPAAPAAPACAGRNHEGVVDPQKLRSLRELSEPGDDVDFLDQLIDTFTRDAPAIMDRLRECAQHLNFSGVHHNAHHLKGASAELGIPRLSDLCHTLEGMGRNGQGKGIVSLMLEASAELDRALEELVKNWRTPGPVVSVA